MFSDLWINTHEILKDNIVCFKYFNILICKSLYIIQLCYNTHTHSHTHLRTFLHYLLDGKWKYFFQTQSFQINVDNFPHNRHANARHVTTIHVAFNRIKVWARNPIESRRNRFILKSQKTYWHIACFSTFLVIESFWYQFHLTLG